MAQLGDLATRDLFEIGSHTVSHLDFAADLTPGALSAEIDGDRLQLEDWTGQTCAGSRIHGAARGSWCPWPSSTSDTRGSKPRSLRSRGRWTSLRDRFLLPRQSIDVLSRPSLWDARLSGGYDFVFAAQAIPLPTPADLPRCDASSSSRRSSTRSIPPLAPR